VGLTRDENKEGAQRISNVRWGKYLEYARVQDFLAACLWSSSLIET
jgi:hypothetical protein